MTNFADRLIDTIKGKSAPITVGLDPIYSRLPISIREHKEFNDEFDVESAVDAIFEFCTRTLRIIAPHIPCVKLNIAFFERYYWEGIEAYYSLIEEARDLGLIVIGDVKRADIPSTNQPYAQAHLADPDFDDMEDTLAPDAITVNPYFGLEALNPFFEIAKREDKGVFVVLRTTNPEAKTIQDFTGQDGKPLYEHIANELKQTIISPEFTGAYGYSSIGVVVGATDPTSAERLRNLLPNAIFLVPGYGVQGGNVDTIKNCFNSDGLGAIISASRSIIYAYENEKYASLSSWEQAVEQAVIDMKQDISSIFA